MNRILFEKDEIDDGFVSFSDERAEHVLKILHGEVGQTLKTGEVNGLIGTSEIVLIKGKTVRVKVNHKEESLKPWIDLILAPPRPRVMKRLLPQLATMGVNRITLVGAKKVEKDFWGATLLREENFRPLLVEGLMQAGTSILPEIRLEKSFNRYLKSGIEEYEGFTKIVAHPYEKVGDNSSSGRKEFSSSTSTTTPTTVLAIGPEGGWTDEEVAALEERGFTRYSLGERILRTDTATIALLARLDATR